MTAPVYYFLPAVKLSVRLYGDDRRIATVTEEDIAKNQVPIPDVNAIKADFFETTVVPLNFRLERNSFMEPDEVNLAIPYHHLPVNPEIVRALRIELYGSLVDGEQFGEAMQTGKGRPFPPMDRDHLLFVGYVDKPEQEITGRNGVVTMQARDYQALIEDTPLPASLASRLSYDWAAIGAGTILGSRWLGEQIVNWVTDEPCVDFTKMILAQFPALSAIRVKAIGDAGKSQITRASAGRKNTKQSVWDYLQRRLLLAGVIPYLWHDTLYLVRSGDLETQRPFGWQAKFGTFNNQIVKQPLDGPLFVAGYNVIDPMAGRELGRHESPPIEIRMYNPVSGITKTRSYPPRTWRTYHPERKTLDGEDSAPRVIELEYDPKLEPQLLEIAEALYKTHGIAELSLAFETREWSTADMDPSAADLLQLASGDPIYYRSRFHDETRLEKGDIPTDFTRIAGMSVQNLRTYLTTLGYTSDVALKLATALKSDIPDQYKLRRMTIDWDADQQRMTASIEGAPYLKADIDTTSAEATFA